MVEFLVFHGVFIKLNMNHKHIYIEVYDLYSTPNELSPYSSSK